MLALAKVLARLVALMPYQSHGQLWLGGAHAEIVSPLFITGRQGFKEPFWKLQGGRECPPYAVQHSKTPSKKPMQ